MKEVKEYLLDAFQGESQANRKYLAFAQKAEAQGLTQIAKIFKAAAEAETIHALNHLKVMGGIRDTVENLKEAIDGETYEFNQMYPEMIEAAKKSGDKEALRTFHFANEVEKVHAELFKKALKYAESGNDAPQARIHVCPVCGYTVEGEVPDKCPVCGTKGSSFKEIA